MALESETPSTLRQSSSVSTYVATFEAPEWAVVPSNKSIAVRFDVMRVSKTCGVCELARKFTVFGREQGSVDVFLANPSVSRKHAAVVHCPKGGVYIVDLMSRHGTFVGKIKIPPHDPYLLHENDVITFGQSCRTYVLKGVDPEGISRAVKRTWRLKSLVPKFGTTTPHKKPAPRRFSDTCVKMVNKICSGTYTVERADEFASAVSELDDELIEDVAGYLVEKLKAHNASAAQVILEMLKSHVGIKEFENNLSGVVQASQTNVEAREIVKAITEARIETHRMNTPSPSEDDDDDDYRDDYAPPSIPYAPPAATYSHPVAPTIANPPAPTYAPPASINTPATMPPPAMERSTTYIPPSSPKLSTVGSGEIDHEASYQSEEEKQEEDDDDEKDTRYRQRVLSNEGKRLFAQATQSPVAQAEDSPVVQSSGFSFITPSSPSPVAQPSAFSFIAGPTEEEYESDQEAHEEYQEEEIIDDVEIPEGFLAEQPSMDPQDFSNLWQSATVSYVKPPNIQVNFYREEWAEDLVHDYDSTLLERCLLGLNVTLLANGVVAGVHKFFYYAEQASNGTIFMVEVNVNETIRELSATFKWIELGLLYDDGHLLFIKLFQACLAPCYVPDHPRKAYLRRLILDPVAPSSTASPVSQVNREVEISETANDEVLVHDTESFEATLATVPDLDPSTFESLYVESIELDTIADALERDLPSSVEIIAQFQARSVFCIAHGTVDGIDKFYFYAKMAHSQCLYFMELSLERATTQVSAACKYLPNPESPIQEDVAMWFLGLVEELLVELE
ncbi:hypothetical protein THRCLA_11250 [Thraustotheca clavata]|uniref:FHA domain-containing protein n=1 Tax=Thraustotheca clavata TaxID=74557 RepID=A0A1V9Y8B7_9STRA|nr:hypothetical protein THRCLA_11250 [Thraustotheca clavata]